MTIQAHWPKASGRGAIGPGPVACLAPKNKQGPSEAWSMAVLSVAHVALWASSPLSYNRVWTLPVLTSQGLIRPVALLLLELPIGQVDFATGTTMRFYYELTA